MTTLFIDGDACPVREEAFRVATRLNLPVKVVVLNNCGDGIQQSEFGETCDVGPGGDGVCRGCRFIQIR